MDDRYPGILVDILQHIQYNHIIFLLSCSREQKLLLPRHERRVSLYESDGVLVVVVDAQHGQVDECQ